MSATTARAEWLKTEERFATAIDPAVEAAWGESAQDTSQSSPLVEEGPAITESARQLLQLAPVRARDVAVVAGLQKGLEGKTVRLRYDGRFGMGAYAHMLVLRAREDRTAGVTELEGEVLL
jgi:hypothetical protein